ncbi:MAG: beta-lactamase [Hydrocarboniphaga sp.]|uniref:hypothetical protein n=1 Tax=Hydrocarboniphaga sp. TaxID=2033016 RepID=UPI0026064FA0|nr:hypothetical protein [Hydrocarboniphaga sp.]MDB5972713.1 beta-lactamase [Hydrocarboniphaga sp.]
MSIRRLLSVLLFSGLLASLPALAADADPASALIGPWQAKKRFGPDVSGTLTLVRSGAGGRAFLAGREAEARFDGDTVSFALACEEGAFCGALVEGGRRVRGFWTQPKTVIGGLAYKTPVELAATSAGLWSGAARPPRA